MDDLVATLERRAERGHVRGAAAVLHGATRDADAPEHVDVTTRRRRGGPRVGVLVGVAVVVVVALIAALVALTGGSDDDRVHVAGAGRTMVQLVGYGDGTNYEDLVFADPETGTTRRVAIAGSCFCDLVVLDGTIWGDDDLGVFRVDRPYDALTRVGATRGVLFPTLDGSGVWLASGRVGAASVRRIDAKTNEVGPAIPLPAGSSITDHPAAEVVGGILIFGDGYPRPLSIWDPETGAVRELVAEAGNLGATYTAKNAHSSQVMYRDAQQVLHIVDTASGRSIPITVNGETVRGIGGGAFSPDGKTIAAFVNVSTSEVGNVPGGRIAQLMLVDPATGVGRIIEHDPVGFEEYGWATWARDGSRVFFGTFGGPALAVGPGETTATVLPLEANYTWKAIDVQVATTADAAPTPTTPSPSGAVTATWTPMVTAPDAIPTGTNAMTVTSMVEFGDRLIAAGNVYGTDASVVGNPVVWTTTNGERWAVTWNANAIVGGSSSNPRLAVLGKAVWIFHGGTAGTAAWRSTDGLTWERVQLPEAMSSVSVHAAAERDGVIVAVSNDKFARGDVLWRSNDDGASWERVGTALGANAQPTSIVATGDGFLIGGVDSGLHVPTVWTSPDGEDWTRSRLDTNAGQVWSVAASNGAVVVDGTADDQPATWYRDGDSWLRADTAGAQTFTAAPNSRLQSIRDGFALIDARPYALRVSRDGKTWTDSVSANAPEATVVLGAAAGDSLVVWVGESNGAGGEVTRPWRVDFG